MSSEAPPQGAAHQIAIDPPHQAREHPPRTHLEHRPDAEFAQAEHQVREAHGSRHLAARELRHPSPLAVGGRQNIDTSS